MQDYRKLKVWQRAQEACVRVYKLTARYLEEERYGLSAQLRGAGVSVGANISEGSKRSTNADKARLWNIAQSSAAEVMSELDVAIRIAYPGKDEATALADEYDPDLGDDQHTRGTGETERQAVTAIQTANCCRLRAARTANR